MQIITMQNTINNAVATNGVKLNDIRISSQAGSLCGVRFTDDDLNSILATNRIGVWKFDIQTQQVELCTQARQFLGFKAGTPLSLYNVIRRLVMLNAFALLKSLKASCQSHSQIDEVIKTDSSTDQWLKITGGISYTGKNALKMMGTVADITVPKAEEQRQKDLMAFLSHELRTPLSTMKLYIQHAHKVALIEKNITLADRLIKADSQTVAMAAMIDNFLMLSQAEACRMLIKSTRFDLTSLVNEVTANAAFIYPNRIFKIELAKPVMIEADREKIGRVINNYLSNAVKYSPENSAIKISCKKSGKHIKVKVSDEGPGISAANQKQLFKRYSRVHSQNAIRVKGFGLGLFLSKEIIEEHGGKVWVKSRLGDGATFGFSLKC